MGHVGKHLRTWPLEAKGFSVSINLVPHNYSQPVYSTHKKDVRVYSSNIILFFFNFILFLNFT